MRVLSGYYDLWVYKTVWSRWGRFWSSVALVIIPLLISSIYAGIIGRPYERAEAEELKKQIQKEQGYR